MLLRQFEHARSDPALAYGMTTTTLFSIFRSPASASSELTPKMGRAGR
jgi:phosphoenolpyruvate carboxylase